MTHKVLRQFWFGFNKDYCWKVAVCSESEKFLDNPPLTAGLLNCQPDDCPFIFFVIEEGSPQENFDSVFKVITDNWNYGLPIRGWRKLSFGTSRLWVHDETDSSICCLGEPGTSPDQPFQIICESMLHRKILKCCNLILHAAMAELGGKAVVLSAASGIGKSTCMKRLQPPWKAHCDEEVLVLKMSNQYFAAPVRKEINKYGNMTSIFYVDRILPLSAIFFLQQSSADRLHPMGRGEATMRICHSASQKFKLTELSQHHRIFGCSLELARMVPSCILHTTLTGRFWEKMEEMLEHREGQGLRSARLEERVHCSLEDCKA
jgi:SynChlorMet cassette protein ScmC